MRILYVAKHGSGGNDEEGAIYHALTKLGHDVVRTRENEEVGHVKADLCLFHGWAKPETDLEMPKVCWYFDLVCWPDDPTLAGRNVSRMMWLERVTQHADLVFCTDGDAVGRDTSGKLVQLTQAADERVAGDHSPSLRSIPILFTGTERGGAGRKAWVDAMHSRYGSKFCHFQGVHGRALGSLISSSRVVVAPDCPVTDRYCSNRAYLTLGFGGLLLHPSSRSLAEHYKEGEEILFYGGRDDMHEKIGKVLSNPGAFRGVAAAGLRRTLAYHTYTHRCQELLRIVKERINV